MVQGLNSKFVFWSPWVLTLCALLGGLGCPKRIPLAVSSQVLSWEELLARIEKVEEGVHSVRGEAKLKVDSPRGKGTVTLFVAVSEPSWVHLESLDFFGRPSAVLVSDGVRFALHQVQEGVFYEGPASLENLALFLPVPLSLPELTRLLLGKTPRIATPKPISRYDSHESVYIVELENGSSRQTLAVRPEDFRVSTSETQGTSNVKFHFESFAEKNLWHFPKKVHVEVPQEKTRLEFNYTDIGLNVSVDSALFHLAPPPNVLHKTLDARGHPLN